MTLASPPLLDVERLRADTPGCAGVTHLNNAGSALPPAIVTQTQIDHLLLEQAIGGYEAHALAVDRVSAVYGSVATLVGCRPDQVALVESATVAWATGFSAIHHTRPFGAGDRLLVSSSEYGSNVLPVMQLARARGVLLEFIPDDASGCVDVEAFASLIGPDVAAVLVNQCPSQNGLVNDVAGIGAALRSSGSDAWYLVDACQAVGQLPVSASAIGADFLSATGRKFLRAPRGTGFLVASDRAITELEPFPIDMQSATWQEDGYALADGATRFESFEKSYAAVLGMGAAIDYALACGIEAIAARIDALASHARAALSAVPGVTVLDRGASRSGIVTFMHASMPASDLAARIRAGGVNVSLSTPEYSRIDFDGHGVAGLVRISPHAYNTVDEIDRAVALI